MAQFKPAFDFLMSHEDAARSGKVTRDGDGRTRFGICERFHKLPEEFWNKPAAAALMWAETIYRVEYWAALQLGEIVDQAVASKIFDMAVVMGENQATRLVQKTASAQLMGSTRAPSIDGIMGDRTIAAVNFLPPASVVEALCNLSKIFFCETADKNPAKKNNLTGWLKRAADVPPHAAAAGASA